MTEMLGSYICGAYNIIIISKTRGMNKQCTYTRVK